MEDFHVESTLGKCGTTEPEENYTSLHYWELNTYLPNVDSVINNFKNRFETIPLAEAVHAFVKFDKEGAALFINNYKDIFHIK